MTTTVSNEGKTIVPLPLRKKFHLTPGTMLEWREAHGAIRVTKIEEAKTPCFLEGLKKLGRVPAAPRSAQCVC